MPTARQTINLPKDCFTGPVRVTPNGLTWHTMTDQQDLILIAPAEFILACEEHVKAMGGFNFTVSYSDKPREDGLTKAKFTCVDASAIEPIPADQSPNGKELLLLQRIHLSKRQVQTMRQEKKRHSWPFKDLKPGEAVEITAPNDFAKQVYTTARTYVHPALDRRIKSTFLPRSDKEYRSVLAWCEDANGGA